MRTLLAIASLLASSAAHGADPVVPDEVIFEKDVEFSKIRGESLQLNIARPKKDGQFPAVVCIHGDGFRAGKRESYDQLCIEFAQRGYVAATISYRLAPGAQLPAAIKDCKTAVRWVRANTRKYGIDPTRIGAMGGSSGGSLAMFLGVTAEVKEFESVGNGDFSSSVKCVVSFSGSSDFTKSYGKSVDADEALPLFFGGNLEKQRKRHVRGSPLSWVTPNAAPTLCIHGTNDEYVAHEQAEWMVARLEASKAYGELLSFPGAGHSLKGDDAKKANEAMFAFFNFVLRNSPGRMPPTERAINSGLSWLQAQQNADGSWGETSQPMLTALALLSFLCHGENREDPYFGASIRKAGAWLVSFGSKNDGRLCKVDGLGASAEARIEHAVITFALCEYFSRTKDETVAPIVEKAVRLVVDNAAKGGGWRANGDPSDSDIRLTAWNIHALKAAHLTGHKFPGLEPALDDAVRWLDTCRSAIGDYRAGSRDVREAAPESSNATVGLAVSARLAWKGDRNDVSKGIDWMLEQTERSRPVRYAEAHAELETWLYNTWATFIYGGAAWVKWDRMFQEEIANAKAADGSWPIPGGKVSGLQAEDSKSGAIYRTTLCILMLEINYRYLASLQGL